MFFRSKPRRIEIFSATNLVLDALRVALERHHKARVRFAHTNLTISRPPYADETTKIYSLHGQYYAHYSNHAFPKTVSCEGIFLDKNIFDWHVRDQTVEVRISGEVLRVRFSRATNHDFCAAQILEAKRDMKEMLEHTES